MTNSYAIIENMMYAFGFLVAANIIISFHLLDSYVSHCSSWGFSSSYDMVTSYFKYQRSLNIALRVAPDSIPVISAAIQLLTFSLQVYMRRISEITIVCITPSVLYNVQGHLWVHVVPQWMDDLIEQLSTKWRNTLLFLTYGEDFTHPPPLELDESAIRPVRTVEDELERFHPKHGFESYSSVSAYPGCVSPLPNPSKKARRIEQKQQQRQQAQKEEVKKSIKHGNELAGSVLDPTWGVISREVQVSWQAEEERREAIRQLAVQKGRERQRGRGVPPVRR